MSNGFFQDPPRLGNQYAEDRLLREYLSRVLPADVLAEVEPELEELGGLAAGELYDLQLADLDNEPRLTQWDAWGRRIDKIELTEVWRRGKELTAKHGFVATAYERAFGEHARIVQFAKNYVVQASLDVYSCPLAMTDGAAATLLASGNDELMARAVPRLTSRDAGTAWTSGQWMTERTGGSDVGLSETTARLEDGVWRLYGTKWFTSAITSEMALTLARPEGNDGGGQGLALFYVETRDAEGRPNRVFVNRLKDKLGTRKVPTAELSLEGTPAIPVAGLSDGVRAISPMLNVTRTWNAVAAAYLMRRAVALSFDYAKKRHQFGAALIDKPLHRDTLAGMEAETAGAFLLSFRAAEVLGRVQTGEASDEERALLRVLTPVAKLTTAKQAVAVASEAAECFGGAGYVEDTGVPLLLRDAQVLPIWEGTTNVLSLDTLRVMAKAGPIDAWVAEIERAVSPVSDESLRATVESVRQATRRVAERVGTCDEADARRLSMTMGRSLEAALLCGHAQWCIDNGRGRQGTESAVRFARQGVDLI